MDSSERIKNIHLWGIKAAVFLVPVLPLYVSASMVFPYITGKNFAFRILVEFAAALWLPFILMHREYRLRNSAITLSVLTFTFIVGLADILGVSPYNSFWSNYERMEGYITILHLALYFMIIRSVLRTKSDWQVFFGILLLTSVLVGLLMFAFDPHDQSIAIKRYIIEYGERSPSTIGNPPFLASYLLLSVFAGLVLFFNVRRRYVKYLCLASVAINSVAIYLTASRGAILAGMTGIVLGIVFSAGSGKVFRKIILCVLAIMLLAGFFIKFKDSDLIKNDKTLHRFSVMFSEESVKPRLDVWKTALRGVREKPLLGWGQENLMGIYTLNKIPYNPDRYSGEQMIWLDRAHNIVIDWLINSGFSGLMAYLAIYGSVFYVIWRSYRKKEMKKADAAVLVIALIVYFIQNLFTFDTINTYLIFFAFLAYIDNYAGQGRSVPASESSIDAKRSRAGYIGATAVALLCFSSAGYYLNYKPIMKSMEIVKLSFSSNMKGSLPGVLSEFNSALSYGAFSNEDVTSRMISASSYILNHRLIDWEGAKELVEATIMELEKGIISNSHDLKYMTGAIRFYKDIAMYDPSFISRTESLIEKCLRMNPDYQWLYIARADLFLLKKDYEAAFADVNKIAGFDPKNDYGQLKLALAAIYASREDTVVSAFDNIRRIRTAANDNIASGRQSVFSAEELYQIAKTYRGTGNYHKSLEYLKELITVLSYDYEIYRRDFRFHKFVHKADIHMELARTYLLLNDKTNAVKEAEKALALDPVRFREEAGRIID